ncbi:CsbD family protein [Sphingomonas sp. XXL09]|uniref:CsbD family protein n=1 Tax=Sphingomonas sp. XXL09 TaxID=3457787 RepID=UPI00406BDC36
MNLDSIAGQATDLGGKIKEGLGSATGDTTLKAEGKADQATGTARQAYGDAKDMVEGTIRPVVDYARQFIHERPFTAAALGGVLGIAVLNTLRGK